MKPLDRKSHILVLTGAGISAESGIRTFRDVNGLWEDHRVEDVATPEGFVRDPQLVWSFYKQRFQQTLTTAPNPGHLALKKLEDALGDRFWLVTQNVDGLHEDAGNKNLIEMHGSLHRCFCTGCGAIYQTSAIDLDSPLPFCSACEMLLRPDIVWFGEIPYQLGRIEQLLKKSQLLLIVGTSGTVYPAAGFVMTARYFGAKTVAVNLDPPHNSSFIDEFHQGKAGDILPDLVDRWLTYLK